MSGGKDKEQQQLADQQRIELQGKLAEEKRKQDAEDKRVAAQKLQRLRTSSTSGGGLFDGGSKTLG